MSEPDQLVCETGSFLFSPLEIGALVLRGQLIYWVMNLHLKKTVGCDLIDFIFPFEDPYITWLSMSLWRQLIITHDATSFSVLHYDHLTRKNELLGLFFTFHLPVTNNLPFVEVRAHVYFIVFINFIWIDSSQWRTRPEVRRFEVSYYLFIKVFFTYMEIWVILGVVKEHVVIINYALTFLSVLVSGVDKEWHSLRWGMNHQLKFLTLSIVQRDPFSILQEISRINMHELDGHSVGYFDSLHLLDELVIVCDIDLHSSIERIIHSFLDYWFFWIDLNIHKQPILLLLVLRLLFAL